MNKLQLIMILLLLIKLVKITKVRIMYFVAFYINPSIIAYKYLLKDTVTVDEVAVEDGLGHAYNKDEDTFNILNKELSAFDI